MSSEEVYQVGESILVYGQSFTCVASRSQRLPGGEVGEILTWTGRCRRRGCQAPIRQETWNPVNHSDLLDEILSLCPKHRLGLIARLKVWLR